MPDLVLTLPAALPTDANVPWALIDNGRVTQRGEATLASAQLRRLGATRWIGLVPPQVCSVLPCDLPVVAPAKMQAVLRGALEERVLDEDNASAFVAAPASQGRITQAAAVKRQWMAALAAQKLPIQSLIPALALLPAGHARVEGDWTWLHSISGELAVLPSAVADTSGLQVLAADDAEWLVRATAHPFELLSGEFAPAGGVARVGTSLKLAALAGWAQGWLKPFIAGCVACLLVAVVGLQAKAMQLRAQLAERAAQQQELAKKALPNVPVIVDAPLQLQKELRLARVASGEPNPGDAEAMLAAVASATNADVLWQSLRYANGELSLQAAQAFTQTQLDALAARGYSARREGNLLVVQLKAGR
jgi:general secretion pathway protein L